MTAFDPVGMMDSGIGGLPYLESARLLLPDQSFVYLADREGFPYGTKSRAEVESIVLDRARRLVAHWHPRALVIACNTASQAALAAVRADNPGIPVIGTVPAIKPAAERSKTRIVGILATAGAIGDPYLDDLVANFARGSRVARRAAQDLVEFVERRFIRSTAAERREAVLPHVRYLVDEGVDEIVLACTHFLHVAADIAAVAAELSADRGRGGVEVIDSREGVARRLRQVLEAEGGLGDGRGPGGGVFLVTGEEPIDACYEDFAGRYGLEGPLRLDPAP